MYKYCGPYWSDGKWQSSVRGAAAADNDLDECCKQHDAVYFDRPGAEMLTEADEKFSACAGNKGFIGRLMAYGVQQNKLFRSIPPKPAGEKMTKNLRGTPKQVAAMPKQNKPKAMAIRTQNAPVSLGTVIRTRQPQLTRISNGASLIGADFVGTVEGNGVSDFGVGKCALLSPAYFVGTFLGNLCRSFERYRWKRLRIHYVPKVSTATAGQVILTSSRSVSEPCLNPNSGTFLQRAMSQGNASMGPLWMENFIDIDCEKDWMLVDPATTSDPDDSIHEELQVFTQTSSLGQVGYLYAEYAIEFTETVFQPHSTSLPIYTGPGMRVVFNDALAINAVGDDVSWNDTAGTLGLGSIPNGTIYRAVIDIMGSSAPTGTTFTNAWNAGLITRITTVAQTATTSTVPIVGGLTIYLTLVGTTLAAYFTLEGAISGAGNGQVFVRTATTSAGTYSADVSLIRYGNSIIPTVQ